MRSKNLFALALAASLCAPVLTAQAQEKARVIFMRLEERLGVNAPADLLEVRDGKPEYIGRLWQGEKLVVEAASEKKHYMTLGGGVSGGEFLYTEALTPGKTYYVMLRFHGGTGGIIPVPVREKSLFPPSAPTVTAAIEKYKLVTPSSNDRYTFASERAASFVQNEYERISRAYAKNKVQAERDERTLRAQDEYPAR